MIPAATRWTERLRLDPIGTRHAYDLWRMHQDARIAEWYAGRWSEAQAMQTATSMGDAWVDDGVSKWIAWHRDTCELVGRGGGSRVVIDGASCLEIGWAIRDAFLRQGYATEIGRESLAFAFEVLRVAEVIAFTEIHNVASRAVMDHLGMQFDREIIRAGLVEGREGVQPDARFALYRIGRPGYSPE